MIVGSRTLRAVRHLHSTVLFTKIHKLARNMCLTQYSPTSQSLHLFDVVVVLQSASSRALLVLMSTLMKCDHHDAANVSEPAYFRAMQLTLLFTCRVQQQTPPPLTPQRKRENMCQGPKP